MQKIDFMIGNKFIKDDNDIQMIVIAPNGDMYLASRKYNGLSMKNDLKIPGFNDNELCQYHAHYMKVLLYRYFKNNPNYETYINNKDIYDSAIDATSKLVNDGFIVFYNITLSDRIRHNEKEDPKIGIINLNKQLISKEQEKSLLTLEEELKDFDAINIPEYLGKEKGYKDNYIYSSDQICKTILKSRSKTR